MSVLPAPILSIPLVIAAIALWVDSIVLSRVLHRLRQENRNNSLRLDHVQRALKAECGQVIATLFSPVFYVIIYGCFARGLPKTCNPSIQRFSCTTATHSKDIFWIVCITQIPTLPLIHWFIETESNPLVACLVTGLTLWSVLHYYAQYNAITANPIEIENETLYYRYGFSWYAKIPLDNIVSVRPTTFKDTKFNGSYFLSPFGTSKNVVLHFKEQVEFKGFLFKRKRKHNAVIAIDNISEFVHTLNRQLGHPTGHPKGHING